MRKIYQLIDEIKDKRKRKLIALAYCRSVEEFFDQRSKDYLDKLELFVDGKIEKEDLKKIDIWETVDATYQTYISLLQESKKVSFAWRVHCACRALYLAEQLLHEVDNLGSVISWIKDFILTEKRFDIIKDIYNPNTLDLTFSEQAISIAEQVYNGDDKARFILSDLLEDENYPVEVVSHLKLGEHFKGCWLIDQILRKS